MATVTGFTAARMQQIEDSSVVSGAVNASYRLILTKNDGTTIDAGYVRGATGAAGAPAQAVMSVENSDSIELALSGVGTVASPWKVGAKARIGTTAQRDAAFPDPVATADKVALANRQIIWYNTDFGWFESYYTAIATGTVVPILVGGAVSGWFPTHDGPSAKYGAVGSQAHGNNSVFTNWQGFGTGKSWRDSLLISRPTADLGVLRTELPGRYDLDLTMYFPNGSGTGVYEFAYIESDGAATTRLQNPVVLQATFGQTIQTTIKNVPLGVGGRCFMRTIAATWAVGDATSTHMTMRYIGPNVSSR